MCTKSFEDTHDTRLSFQAGALFYNFPSLFISIHYSPSPSPMPIPFPPDLRAEAAASIARYVAENLDTRIGHLASEALLDFFLEDIGPAVYNQAIADVQAHLQHRLTELDVELHQEVFQYWIQRDRKKRGR
jgi:uncharacterized protein (DUF2164 family)